MGRVSESQFPMPDALFARCPICPMPDSQCPIWPILDARFSMPYLADARFPIPHSPFPMPNSNFLLLVNAIEQPKSPENPDKVGNSGVSIGEYHKYV